MKNISIIAALQEKDRGLGLKNDLLIRIHDDLKRFKSLTTGHPIIMGRKTFESLGEKALPNRTNIVLTRNASDKKDGIIFSSSLEEAFSFGFKNDDGIFVIGGGEIYKQAIPFADRLFLTIVKSDLPADTFFPPYDEFTKIVSEEIHTDEKTGYSYSFLTLEK